MDVQDPLQLQHHRRWRDRALCSVLFWTTPYSWTAGTCPTGWQHDPHDARNNIGLQYLLPHDIGAPAGTQEWRFCLNCNGLFFRGYFPNTGSCPAGGGHTTGAQDVGYRFAIPVYSY
jgi:hypothetical protein